MPIYEFECRACHNVWDALQKLSDPDPSNCPNCGKAEVQRRMTAPSFRLKGSGWYETDFKKDGDTKRNLADGASSEPKPEASKSADAPIANSTPAAPSTAPAPAPSTDA